MAKTVVNLTDTLSTLVTKVNQISTDLGDVQGHGLYDSSAVGILSQINSKADSTNNTDVRAAISSGTANTLGFNQTNGQISLIFDSAEARKLLSIGSEATASGDGGLAYNNSTGVFTYTPPTRAGLGAGTMSNLVEDTTPQLGGDLDANSKRIKFGDNDGSTIVNKLVFGADSDLKIFHNASHSIIEDAGTGSLQLRTNSLAVQNASGSESQITGLSGGAVTLFHNNSPKLATSGTGITVTGKTATTTLSIGGVDVTSDAGELNILDGVTADANELNLLDLNTGEQVGVFKVEAISAGNPVIGDFTNNTKIIFQF